MYGLLALACFFSQECYEGLLTGAVKVFEGCDLNLKFPLLAAEQADHRPTRSRSHRSMIQKSLINVTYLLDIQSTKG